jgi:hypothetical protein
MNQITLIGPSIFPGSKIFAEIQFKREHLGVRREPLLWLSVTCLDAPFVAIAWQWLFSHAFSIAVPAASRVALFFTAWLIYLIDRFADSVSLDLRLPKSIRQQFCFNHRKWWVVLMSGVGIVDVGIIFNRLDNPTILRGLIFGTIALCYLAANWRFSKIWEFVPIKEVIIGSVFASGTLVGGSLSATDVQSTIAFACAVGIFAVLCSLNCISIAAWERDLDLAQAKHSAATRSRTVEYFARAALVVVASLSVILFLFGELDLAFASCLAISSGLLWVLHFASVSRDERTALADLALLTPFAFLFVEKLL